MRLVIALGIAVGLLLGIGGYTFIYARGYSYLTNNPEACVNCHVMQEQYSGWITWSHRSVAVCNDCHAPHDVVGKYVTKVRNGFWHSFYFTTGGLPDPIQTTPRSARVTEEACRTCHDPVVQAIDPNCPTSSRRRTRWAFTRHRSLSGSSRCRWITRAKAKSPSRVARIQTGQNPR